MNPILFDTHTAIQRLSQSGLTVQQATALAHVTHDHLVSRLHSPTTTPFLPTPTLISDYAALSARVHDLHSTLTSCVHQNRLASMAGRDRASSALQACLDTIRDTASNGKTELAMVLAAGRAEGRGEMAAVELAVAKSEASLASMVQDVKGRLEGGKTAFITSFIVGMVACFGAIAFRSTTSAS